jgi:hypothetical protein
MKLYRNLKTNLICQLVVIQGPKVRDLRNPLNGEFHKVTDEEWSEWEMIVEDE